MKPQLARNQPRTAAEARAQAAVMVADNLVDTQNEYAFHGHSSEIRSMCISTQQLIDAGIPRGTRSHDEWGFAWVRRFAEQHGATWMRPAQVETGQEWSEVWFAMLALRWICLHMRASPRKLKDGATRGQPPSALLAIYGWRRVQKDCGRHLCDMSSDAVFESC